MIKENCNNNINAIFSLLTYNTNWLEYNWCVCVRVLVNTWYVCVFYCTSAQNMYAITAQYTNIHILMHNMPLTVNKTSCNVFSFQCIYKNFSLCFCVQIVTNKNMVRYEYEPMKFHRMT